MPLDTGRSTKGAWLQTRYISHRSSSRNIRTQAEVLAIHSVDNADGFLRGISFRTALIVLIVQFRKCFAASDYEHSDGLDVVAMTEQCERILHATVLLTKAFFLQSIGHQSLFANLSCSGVRTNTPHQRTILRRTKATSESLLDVAQPKQREVQNGPGKNDKDSREAECRIKFQISSKHAHAHRTVYKLPHSRELFAPSNPTARSDVHQPFTTAPPALKPAFTRRKHHHEAYDLRHHTPRSY